MKVINVKGYIIPKQNKWLYDWFEYPYTTSEDVSNSLLEADGEDVEVHINSYGGSVYDGYEIYTALRDYKGNVLIKIVGLAASAASFIAMAGKCLMSPLAEMMIHNASTSASGNHQVMDSTSQMLQVTDSTIAKAYMIKSGKSEDEIRNLMSAETWLGAEQCKELGLIDGIMFEEQKNLAPVLFNSLPIPNFDALKELEKCGSIEELKKKLAETQPIVVNTVVDNKNKKREDNVMTLEQLKTDHADLYNQIVNEATSAERGRINEINELSMPGLENLIKEGIENGHSAEKVAMNIIKAQKEKGAKHIANAKNDAEEANLDDVNNAPTPQNVDKKQDAVNLLVSAAASIMGGRD